VSPPPTETVERDLIGAWLSASSEVCPLAGHPNGLEAMQMIVIGLDVHKRSVTAVAVDEAGRPLAEKVVVVGSEELLGWAAALGAERLWAVEDCRQLTAGWSGTCPAAASPASTWLVRTCSVRTRPARIWQARDWPGRTPVA
jgi:hypothetical protein